MIFPSILLFVLLTSRCPALHATQRSYYQMITTETRLPFLPRISESFFSQWLVTGAGFTVNINKLLIIFTIAVKFRVNSKIFCPLIPRSITWYIPVLLSTLACLVMKYYFIRRLTIQQHKKNRPRCVTTTTQKEPSPLCSHLSPRKWQTRWQKNRPLVTWRRQTRGRQFVWKSLSSSLSFCLFPPLPLKRIFSEHTEAMDIKSGGGCGLYKL